MSREIVYHLASYRRKTGAVHGRRLLQFGTFTGYTGSGNLGRVRARMAAHVRGFDK
jgi:hypothetical protein